MGMTDQQKPTPPPEPTEAPKKNSSPPAEAPVAGQLVEKPTIGNGSEGTPKPEPVQPVSQPSSAVTESAKSTVAETKPEPPPITDTKVEPIPASPPISDQSAGTEKKAVESPDSVKETVVDDKKPEVVSQPEPIPPSERQTEKLTRPAELIKPWSPQTQDDPTVPGRGSGLPQTAQLNPDLVDTLKENPDETRSSPPPPPEPGVLSTVAAAVTAAAKVAGVDLTQGSSDDTVRPAPKVANSTDRLPDLEKIVPGVSSGIICPNCAHQNRPGELICDNCGTSLITGGKAALGTRDLVREQEARPGEKLLDTGTQKALATAGGAVFTENMVLRLEIESGSNPMLIYPKAEIVLGRRDPNTGAIPDVDLTAYAGYRLGVSRRHSIIRMQDKNLFITDLGSSNGTYLNGTRLPPHRPHQLRDGDEVRLGQMALRLYFQSGRR